MPRTVKEIMTPNPVTISVDEPVVRAASIMKDQGIGDVLVKDSEGAFGILTDRDIVTRCIADGNDPEQMTVGEACSPDLVTVAPESDAGEAVRTMRDHAVRRLAVIDNGAAVGIVSIGDMAEALDDDSLLAEISARPANN